MQEDHIPCNPIDLKKNYCNFILFTMQTWTLFFMQYIRKAYLVTCINYVGLRDTPDRFVDLCMIYSKPTALVQGKTANISALGLLRPLYQYHCQTVTRRHRKQLLKLICKYLQHCSLGVDIFNSYLAIGFEYPL